jgi:GT2 family glycosyltransferase
MPKVAIVILNWNGRIFLEKFLPSVVKHNPDVAEIIIADNGSDDDSEKFMQLVYPFITFIKLEKNYGYTGGYNRALQQIEAEYFILLNSDIEVSAQWIEPMMKLMDNDHTIAACQPVLRSFHQPEKFEYAGAAGGFIDFLGYPFCRGRIMNELEIDQGQYATSIEVFWATGACMMVRASVMQEAGGFDEDFFAHMEEIDLCWRFRRMGYKIIYCPDSVVFHVGGGTLPKNNPRKTLLNFRNNIWLLAKNLPGRKFIPIFIFRMILDVAASLHFLFKGQSKDAKAIPLAWIEVFKNLKRKRNEGRSIPYKAVWPVYTRSIIAGYYFKGKRRFSDLNPADFGRF